MKKIEFPHNKSSSRHIEISFARILFYFTHWEGICLFSTETSDIM